MKTLKHSVQHSYTAFKHVSSDQHRAVGGDNEGWTDGYGVIF